jgi:hypothetical protein
MRIRDPRWENLDPGWKKFGSRINIPDPQHCKTGSSKTPMPVNNSTTKYYCGHSFTRVADLHSFHPNPDPAF